MHGICILVYSSLIAVLTPLCSFQAKLKATNADQRVREIGMRSKPRRSCW